MSLVRFTFYVSFEYVMCGHGFLNKPDVNCLDVMFCVLFRKVEDLQFTLEEMSIEKADAEVCNFCLHFIYFTFLSPVIITIITLC